MIGFKRQLTELENEKMRYDSECERLRTTSSINALKIDRLQKAIQELVGNIVYLG